VEGVNSNIIYLIHCKNFCKYSDIPPPSTVIIKIKGKGGGRRKKRREEGRKSKR
jgi:hypothetical protein